MGKTIVDTKAFQILDSRGEPTLGTTVTLSDGSTGTGLVPSGASTGQFEAFELRDNDKSVYWGKGVTRAINNVNKIIAPILLKLTDPNLPDVDQLLIDLDSTKNKHHLGANATLAVSLAFARASAKSYNLPLYRYLGGFSEKKIPIPMLNILNGGAHASNNIDIQEFMIMPTGAKSFSEGLRWCCEVYHALGVLLKENGYSVSVGDEGGFAPNLSSNNEAIEIILEAINKAGYSAREIKLALDAASSAWFTGNGYYLPKSKQTFSSTELIDYWCELCNKYPIFSLEDPLGEIDYDGWRLITAKLGKKVQLVGDDLFVTTIGRLNKGITQNLANAILIKPNQIGTLSETFKTIEKAKAAGFATVMSHRSGETIDSSIADISVACGCWQIKSGAPCRGERVAKYNRLLCIESELIKPSRGHLILPKYEPSTQLHVPLAKPTKNRALPSVTHGHLS